MTIDVVYLAYYNPEKAYNYELVEDNLSSYKVLNSGIQHSLVIIAKNWTDPAAYEKLKNLAQTCNARLIELPDDGWDFGAYFRVVKLLNSDYILFIGSSSRILCNDWLKKLYSAFLFDPYIQLVGAMGSWDALSMYTFPNYHIRTCSFMIKKELFLEYANSQKFPLTKEDTYRFEQGENSITKFIMNKGYKAAVVNSDGEIFLPENWVNSKTYRYPDEIKCIIIDKLAAFYYSISEAEKRYFETRTWGRPLKN